MRSIITVIRHPTLVGTYQVSSSMARFPGAKQDVKGAEAAAAQAMMLAIKAGLGYHVFAPAEVLALIPQDMQGKP